MIKRAYVSRKTEDTGQFPIAQVAWSSDKVANTEVLLPYGLSSYAPVNSMALMFNVMGQEENRAAIINDPKNRFKGLKEGEVALGNYKTKSVIKFLENGDIEITTTGNTIVKTTGNMSATIGGTLTANVTGATNITTPTMTLTGNLVVTGTISATGEITAFSGGTPITMTDIKTTFNSHTHDENDNAPNPTDGPNSTI